jgi:hypothetical protein
MKNMIEAPIEEQQQTKAEQERGRAGNCLDVDWTESEFFEVWLRIAREGQQREGN